MHPRSPYQSTLDFTILAQAYPDLEPYLTGNTLDFQNDNAQRALTRALLHRDFDLTIDLPSDRLCPPVPNRLNYVLWIQDIVLAHEEILGDFMGGEGGVSVHGIDIGTGASAIYPLLACRLEPRWRFAATELDPESFTYACANVRRNGLARRVRVVRVGGDEVGGTMEDPHIVDDMDQAGDGDARAAPATPSDAPESDGVRRGTPPFGFERLFQQLAEEGAAEDTGPPEGGRPRPHSRIEFTMCNPPFYGSAAEVEAGVAAKEAGPLGVCTGAPVEMITPGGEARFVGRMVRESAGASPGRDPRLPGEPSSGSSRRDPRPSGRGGEDAQPRAALEGGGGKCALEGPGLDGRAGKRLRVADADAGGTVPASEDMMTARWYTAMLGRLGSVGEVVRELGACGISNYAVTEFVQGQTRRWAVGWSRGGFRLPDATARIAHPNPTLQRLLPPRTTLRFPHLRPPPPAARRALERLQEVLASVAGVRARLCAAGGRACNRDDDDGGRDAADPERVPGPDTRLLVHTAGDMWSRSARRGRKGGSQARLLDTAPDFGPCHTAAPAPDRGTDIDTDIGADMASAALVCSISWPAGEGAEGGALEVRWVYGFDRALFESFASHVAGRLGAGAGAG